MSWLLVAGLAFAATAIASGWFIVRGSTARLAGSLVVVLGGTALVTCVLAELGSTGSASRMAIVAGFLVFPVIVVIHPRAPLTSVPTFLALVVTAGAGVLSVFSPVYVGSAGLVAMGAMMAHLWWRFERGDSAERRALAWSTSSWFAIAFLTILAGFVVEGDSSVPLSQTALAAPIVLLMCLGPIAMAIGAVRPDLVDVRGLVTELVVVGAVGTVFASVAFGVAATGEMVAGRPLSAVMLVLACTALAFGVHPLSRSLRRIIDALLFGDRPDPLDAATAIASRIGDDPALALAAIREALVLPYASLVVNGLVLATTGTQTPHVRRLPLRLQEETHGELVVGLRPGDLRLSPDDEAVLRIVAPLLVQTMRAQSFADDVAASRGSAIAAIEEERRRLRRDLHDGVGPSLTGVAFAADAATNQLEQNPQVARELLMKLRSDTADAIAEIRRLVEGLRPGVLDELGLVAAIKQFAAGLHAAGGRAIRVEITSPPQLGPLPAAVEVAAYRIALEALTNIARHASAEHATVELAREPDRLMVRITDDGTTSQRWPAGSGMESMRERAQQVRGTLSAGPADEGGVVEAILPL